MAGRIVVGTSSWADPGFVADWYPPGLPVRERLSWYAEHFDAVEVNSTFYAIPMVSAVARWVDETPAGFTFDVKLHRLLSRHAAPLTSLPRDLRDDVELGARGRVRLTPELEAALAERTLESVQPLVEAGRLAPFLLQLSPAFAPGRHALSELDALVERLAPHPVAVELRHRAWVRGERREETLGHLEKIGAIYVCVDAPQGRPVTLMPPLDAVTRRDVVYFRAHGRNAKGWVKQTSVAERFGYVYSDAELEELRGRVEHLAEEADEVRMMFNNNASNDAPTAAQRFRQMLGQVHVG